MRLRSVPHTGGSPILARSCHRYRGKSIHLYQVSLKPAAGQSLPSPFQSPHGRRFNIVSDDVVIWISPLLTDAKRKPGTCSALSYNCLSPPDHQAEQTSATRHTFDG
jgi:hypothetical protein